jgi:5,10-methylenetetrahydromethanopterin reductase
MVKAKEFGVGLENPDVKTFIRCARISEELGFRSFWVPEDPLFRGGFSLASAIAASTTSIKIGLGIINPYTRHPALIAMELAALDEVSGGRAILALGASVKGHIEGQLSIPYSKPGTAVRETVAIIRKFFQGEQFDYDGQLFKIRGAKFNFQPLRQKADLQLGVLGPKNLQLAGEVADGVLLSVMTSPAYAKYAMENVKQGAAAKGRNLDNFEVGAYLLISMSDDDKSAREQIKPYLAMMLSLLPMHGIVDHPILSCAGVGPDLARRFGESLAAGKIPVDMVEDWMIDEFAIAGTPARCREGLARIIETGVTHPICFEIAGADPEKTIRDVHTHLMPHFL